MEETNDNTGLPKKKRTIMIIGVCGARLVAAEEAIRKISENGDTVVIVKSVDEIKEKQNPFGPEPIKIKNIEDCLPPKLQFYDSTEHNPWPSPKGRKGKRRW